MDKCTCCCKKCSSRKQGSKSFKNGFPKKLVVAITIVVVVAMCLIPAEARTIEHKIRHVKRHATKEPRGLERPDHRLRPHRTRLAPSLAHLTKDNPVRHLKNTKADAFKNATRKIINKLKNTRRHFNKERSILNETKEYRDGMTSWLPTINFVSIHFHNYSNPRRPRVTVSERKFTFLMPKLYKSLVEFHKIFKQLIQVEVDFPDETFLSYNQTRQDLIGSTLHRLYSTIAEIRENMAAVNIPVPQINHKPNIDSLNMKVDAPQCLKNDYIAFRAYGNLLNNWYSEFRCPRGKKVINNNSRCASYEAKLFDKMISRTQKGKLTTS